MVEWETILIWSFKGPRFEDHGVDLRDLAALAALREAIVAVAIQLWRDENPGKHLPHHFGQSIVLKVFGIEESSAKFRIQTPVEHDEPESPDRQLTLLGMQPPARTATPKKPRPPLRLAAARVVEVVQHVAAGKEPPADLPRDAAKPLTTIVNASLSAEDRIELEVPTFQPAPQFQPEPANDIGASDVRPRAPFSPTHTPGPSTPAEEQPPVAARVEHAPPLRTEIAPANKPNFESYLSKVQVAAGKQPGEPARNDEPIDVTVEVTSADVRRGEARITANNRPILVSFTSEQEKIYTRALHLHESVLLHIVGRGLFDAKRTLTSITHIDSVEQIDAAVRDLNVTTLQDPQLSLAFSVTAVSDQVHATAGQEDQPTTTAAEQATAESTEATVDEAVNTANVPQGSEMMSLLVDHVRLRLGDRYASIASALFASTGPRFSMPEIAALAHERGLDQIDVQTVVDMLTDVDARWLERVFLQMNSEPPTEVAEEEVRQRLRARIEDPGTEETWRAWSQAIRVEWRWTRSPEGQGAS
jgi:hypothetical protein